MCLAEAVNERGVAIVPKAEDDGAQKYAFIVAVSDYDTGISNLQCTVKDARDFKEQLLKLGFEEQNIDLLTSEENFADLPLKKKILSRYDNLLKRVKEGDWVVVYLSGHGVKLQGKEGSWFCPSDTDVENMAETTVSIDEMLQKLSDSKAGFRWMIVDACRNIPEGSKGIFEGIKSPPAQVLETVADPPKNIMLMQSCQPGQCSYEAVSVGNGIFTMSLLEAFSMEADKDQDGTVKFSEIFQYVSERTNELADLHFKKSQIPQVTGKMTDFDFLRDVNFPKAEELLSEALKKMEAKEFETALGLAEQACALCPRVRKFQSEKEKIALKIEASKPKVLKEVTWPADGLTLQEAYDKTAEDGTLTILRGVHDVPETLVIRKNITITGQSTNRDYTVLKGGKQNVLRLETGFAEIKNLTIKNEGDSQDSGTSAVRIHAPLCAFENCLFTSETGSGFVVNQKDSSPIVTRCTAKNCGTVGFLVYNGASGTFTDCEASGNAYPGIEVLDSGTNPTVEKCRFTDGKQKGIFVHDGASGTFTDCEASGNALSGIEVRGSGTNPTVEKCRFTDSKKGGGIYIYDGASGTFTDCEASGNAYAGIEVRDSGTNPTVENCRFTDSKEGGGIFVWQGASGTFTDCESSGNALSGIEVSDSGTNPTVEKCRFTDSKEGSGIFVHDGASGTFTDCKSSGNVEIGIVVYDSGTNPTVENCRFTNNQEAGIVVCCGASGTFTDCEASGNALSGIIVRDSGTNPTVEKCRFTNNQQVGIGVGFGASGTFTDCESSGNALDGIAVRDSGTNPTVEKCRFTDSKESSGIFVCDGASGTFQENTLSGNAKGNWYVDDDSSPICIDNTPNYDDEEEEIPSSIFK